MRELKPEFLKDLSTSDGILKPIVDVVKESNGELVLCFREESVAVYYQCHVLFNITKTDDRYVVHFNLGHGRYTNIKAENILEIKKICEIYEDKSSNDVYFYVTADSNLHIKEIVSLYIKYMNDFFDRSKKYDYYQGCTCKQQKPQLLEKQRQQQIFTNYSKISESAAPLVFYDIEPAIPGGVEKGLPDCLAVKTKNGKVSGIVLTEVKSTRDACIGEHGVGNHFKDFNEIISCGKSREQLYNAMLSAFQYYHALGMHTEVQEFCTLQECEFEMLFLFTDDAISWAKSSRKRKGTIHYNAYQQLSAHDASNEWQRIEFLSNF